MADGLNLDNVIAAEMIARGPQPFPFRIVVPGNWKLAGSSEEPLSADTPSAIAAFEAPFEPFLSIQVLGIVLKHEITAAHWLQYYLTQRGWISNDVAANGPRKARASCTLSVNGLAMAGLLTATVNGNTLILLQSLCPINRFEAAKDVLNLGVRSFTIAAPVDPNIVEPWTAVQLTPKIGFQFPASWSMRRPTDAPPGKAAVDWMRLNDRQIVQGMVRLKSIDRTQMTTIADAMALTVREFQDSGLEFVNAPTPKQVQAPPPWRGMAVIDASGRTNPQSTLHFQCYGLEHDAGVVVIACMGPDAKSDFYNWAINIRAFEIALASLAVSR